MLINTIVNSETFYLFLIYIVRLVYLFMVCFVFMVYTMCINWYKNSYKLKYKYKKYNLQIILSLS